MRKSKFSDSQIMDALKQAEGGKPVPEVCRELGISSATFYKWRSKYGGMDASMIARLKELEQENARLKKCMPRNAYKLRSSRKHWQKSGEARTTTRTCQESSERKRIEYPSGLSGRCYQ